MKAVQNVECFGKHFSSDLEVWLPHIRTNHLNLTTIIRPKVDEEVPQRVFLSVFDDSEKPFAPGVDLVDQRHVLMAYAISDLIDTKGGDVFEFMVFKAGNRRPIARNDRPCPMRFGSIEPFLSSSAAWPKKPGSDEKHCKSSASLRPKGLLRLSLRNEGSLLDAWCIENRRECSKVG